VCQGAVDVLFWLVGYQLLGPLFAQAHLGGARAWGVVSSAFAAGLITGSSVALLWRPARAGIFVCLGTGTMALPLAAMACDAPFPILLSCAALTGIGLDISIVSWNTILQTSVPAAQLGRVNSYNTLGQIILVPVGYVIAGPVVASIGLPPTLWTFVLGIALATLIPLGFRSVRDLRRPTGALGDPAEPDPVPRRLGQSRR